MTTHESWERHKLILFFVLLLPFFFFFSFNCMRLLWSFSDSVPSAGNPQSDSKSYSSASETVCFGLCFPYLWNRHKIVMSSPPQGSGEAERWETNGVHRRCQRWADPICSWLFRSHSVRGAMVGFGGQQRWLFSGCWFFWLGPPTTAEQWGHSIAAQSHL